MSNFDETAVNKIKRLERDIERLKVGEKPLTSATPTANTIPIADAGGKLAVGWIPIDAVYPVGAIYMSVVSTSPATLFGGTWSAWGTGRVPVGIDAGQTEFDTVEETGGAKTHTLSTAEMPAHTHKDQLAGADDGTANNYYYFAGASFCENGQLSSSTGGGQAHNNIQPYIVCYMWKRTA